LKKNHCLIVCATAFTPAVHMPRYLKRRRIDRISWKMYAQNNQQSHVILFVKKKKNNHMLYFDIKGNNGAMKVWEWGLTSLLPNKIEIGLQPLTPLTPKGSNSHHNPRAFGSRPILFHYQY
jgi:hypothetical protein